jgi:hypothetical protein
VLLSGITYQELTRIGSVRQRTDLADVIAEISGFAAITGRPLERPVRTVATLPRAAHT